MNLGSLAAISVILSDSLRVPDKSSDSCNQISKSMVSISLLGMMPLGNSIFGSRLAQFAASIPEIKRINFHQDFGIYTPYTLGTVSMHHVPVARGNTYDVTVVQVEKSYLAEGCQGTEGE